MKRSEMLKIIKSEMFDEIRTSDKLELAEDILNAIEKAGMKPPIVKRRTFVDEEGWSYSDVFYEWEVEEGVR
jgi:hypothetical protein